MATETCASRCRGTRDRARLVTDANSLGAPCLEVHNRDDGLTDVIGAWEWWWFDKYPGKLTTAFAVQFEGLPDIRTPTVIRLVDPDGNQLLRADALLVAGAQGACTTGLALNGVTIPMPGDYELRIEPEDADPYVVLLQMRKR